MNKVNGWKISLQRCRKMLLWKKTIQGRPSHKCTAIQTGEADDR